MTALDQFLILLRSGLWGTPVRAEDFVPEQTHWEQIYHLARIQTVLGVTYDGIEKLPSENQPPKNILMRWYAFVVRIEASHQLLNSTLEQVYAEYESYGAHPVLIKGQGCADNYINPLRRQCGDIDIFVGEADFRRLTDIISSKGIECHELLSKATPLRRFFLKLIGRKTWLMDKHMHYKLNGVDVENHRVVSRLFNPRLDKRFTRLVGEWYPHSERFMQVGQVRVMLPPPNFDVIFELYHAVKHFMIEGLGLRQLCDWVRLLHVYRNQIDVQKLRKDIRSLKMQRTFGVFGYIAVHYLGLPAEEMPVETGKYAALGEQVFACVIREGNFGTNLKANELRPIAYHRGEKFSIKWLFKRIGHVSYIYPSEERWYFISDIRSALKKRFKE